MGFAVPFILYARFADPQRLERLAYYLDPETRPAFPEEVPKKERRLVALFEFLSNPWKTGREAKTLIAYFGDPHYEENLADDITPFMKGAHALGAERVLAWWTFDGLDSYAVWAKGGRKRLVWQSEAKGWQHAPTLPAAVAAEVAQTDDPVTALRRLDAAVP